MRDKAQRFGALAGAMVGVLVWAIPAAATGPAALATSASQRADAGTGIGTAIGTDAGAAERLATAARLRSLVPQMQAAACHMTNGLRADAAHADLRRARNAMRQSLNALEFGDTRLGIRGAEARAATIRDIHAVRVIWAPMKSHVNALLLNAAQTGEREAMRSYDSVLAEYAGVLVSSVSGQYSNPFELMQSDALALDFAARQAMHIHRIARLACEIGAGELGAGATRADTGLSAGQSALDAALQRVDLGFEALVAGMPQLGLRPAPTAEIETRLLAAWARVEGARNGLVRIGAGTARPGDAAAVATALGDAAAEVEQALQAYVRQSKHMF